MLLGDLRDRRTPRGHAQTRVSDRSDSRSRAGARRWSRSSSSCARQVCLGPGFPAVAYGDANEVTFYADLANTTFVPQKRDLTFSPAGRSPSGTTAATSNSARSPPFTFSATPVRTRVILDPQAAAHQRRRVVPFFTYYAFDSGNPVRPANLLSIALDATRPTCRASCRSRVNFSALPSRGGSSISSPGEPFTANVFVRTADPTDPDHSPLCI